MLKLFLLFTVVPFAELYLLLWVSRRIGFGTTLALVLLTGVLGAAMARAEGLRVFRQWQRALAAGQLPEHGVVDGLLVLVGGVLLVTPGVMTDLVGLLLLLPPSRHLVARLLVRRVERAIASGSIRVIDTRPGPVGPNPSPWPRQPGERDVIDTEGETIEPDARSR